jgi:hypothetical protein
MTPLTDDLDSVMHTIVRAFLDYICPVPDEMVSHEQWQRRQHQDLPHLSRQQLSLERGRLELRLTIDRTPDPWLIERLPLVREAIHHAR